MLTTNGMKLKALHDITHGELCNDAGCDPEGVEINKDEIVTVAIGGYENECFIIEQSDENRWIKYSHQFELFA